MRPLPRAASRLPLPLWRGVMCLATIVSRHHFYKTKESKP